MTLLGRFNGSGGVNAGHGHGGTSHDGTASSMAQCISATSLSRSRICSVWITENLAVVIGGGRIRLTGLQGGKVAQGILA